MVKLEVDAVVCLSTLATSAPRSIDSSAVMFANIVKLPGAARPDAIAQNAKQLFPPVVSVSCGFATSLLIDALSYTAISYPLLE